MITIIPIYENDAEKAYREFFEKEFITHQIGTQGRWLGAGAELLKVQNPVKLRTFQNLLHGRTPDGAGNLLEDANHSNRETAWRLTFSAPENLSALWALAPDKDRRQIDRAHCYAVRSTLGYYERWITNGDDVAPWEYRPAALFAAFRSGVGQDQRPDLHSTVFVMNFRLCPEAKTETLTHEGILQHMDKLKGHYEVHLQRSLVLGIGPVLPLKDAESKLFGMPRDLSRKLSLDSSNGGNRIGLLPLQANRLRNDELFVGWQQKAHDLGWGPVKAATYLHAIRQVKKGDQFVGKWGWRAHQGIKALEKVRDSVNKLIHGDRNQTGGILDQARYKIGQQKQLLRIARDSIKDLIHGKQGQTQFPSTQSKNNGQTHSH